MALIMEASDIVCFTHLAKDRNKTYSPLGFWQKAFVGQLHLTLLTIPTTTSSWCMEC